jgi:hypothetical protein
MRLPSLTGRSLTGLVIAAAVVLTALATPASAWAGGPWAVKDVDGQIIGTVRTVSASKAKTSVQGVAGQINRSSRGRWTAYMVRRGILYPVVIYHAALWGKSPAWQLRGSAEGTEQTSTPLVGRIFKRNGRWVVQAGNLKSGWKTWGSVTGACPPWAAGGAVWLALVPEPA